MIGFAALLERLRFCPTPAHRDRVLAGGSAAALAVLAGRAKIRPVPLAVLRHLAAARTDPALFALSQEFLGDFIETMALIWPARAGNAPPPDLASVLATPPDALAAELENWLDASDGATRFALLRLISGKIRPLPPTASPSGIAGTIVAVLMTARSARLGLQGDYSFGVWGDATGLVPVAHVVSADADLDAFVAGHVMGKFGPVREVAPELAAEIAFDGVVASPRHKAGLALQGARLLRLRPEVPAAAAGRLTSLRALLE